MSKYYKADDIINFLNRYCPKDMWEYQIAEVPTIEVSEDCISRDQFGAQMYHRCFEVDNDPNMQKWESGNWLRYKLFEEELEKAPSVVPSRAEGEWIEIDDTTISCRCSICGWEAHLYEDDVYGMPYCPNCGSRKRR